MPLIVWVGTLLLTGFLWKLQVIVLDGSHPTGIAAALRLWELDGGFLALACLVVAVALLWRPRLGWICIAVLPAIAGVWYALDALALKALDRHASAPSLFAFVNAPTVVRDQFPRVAAGFLPALAATLLAYFCLRRARRRAVWWLPLIVAVPGGLFFACRHGNSYDRLAFRHALEFEHWREPEVSPAQLESVLGADGAAALRQHFRADFPDGRPNLILVVVESFSSALSKQAGGVYDDFPLTERALANGTLFTNFFANGENSFLGVGSMLNGLLPLAFVPRGDNLTDFYGVFQFMPSELRTYRDAGYHTLYAIASDWWSQPIRNYLDHVGMQEILDPTNTPELTRFPKHARLNYFSDEALYTTALARLPAAQKASTPFFWTLETMESHDIADHAPSWRKVDRELAAFIAGLEAKHFFEHGVLLVTGDHRMRDGYPIEFAKKFGEGGRGRIPLWLRGQGVAAGRLDRRYFQQADLLRFLGRAIRGGDEPLSPQIVFLDDSIHLTPIRVLAIDEHSVSHAVVSGLLTLWQEAPPPAHRAFERAIERNQALQYRQIREMASPSRSLSTDDNRRGPN